MKKSKEVIATVTSPNNLQIENLLKLAFQRTKERFLPYFIIFLLSFLGGAAVVIVFILLLVLIGLIFNKNPQVLIPSISIIFIAFLYALFYISAWMKLGMVAVLTQTEKLGAIETLKSVKPLINGFIWYAALSVLFFLGILPFGLVTVFIILFLWNIWSSFVVYVYIDYRKKGLQNLWLSRYLVNKNFWGILGRILLVSWGLFVIMAILGTSGRGNGGVSALTFILSIFTGPFVISYIYEIYTKYRENKTVESPKIWLVLSIIGWLILIIGISTFSNFAVKQLPNLIKQIPSKDAPWMQQQNRYAPTI